MLGNNDKIGGREKGETLPISIPTALAIERAGGQHPEIEDKEPPVLKYRLILMNVKTLIRNLHGSVERSAFAIPKYDDIVDALIEDMSITESYITDVSKGGTQVRFYLPTYSSIRREYPRAKVKSASTPNQKEYANLEKNIIDTLRKSSAPLDIMGGDMGPEGKHPSTMLVTHYPVDLLKRASFEKLTLLESHTGKLKGPSSWNSKLVSSKELERIPFNRFTLQLFGDGTHFYSFPHKYKKEIIKLAEEAKWTPTTTRDRMVLTIKRVKDPEVRGKLLELVS